MQDVVVVVVVGRQVEGRKRKKDTITKEKERVKKLEK